MKKIERKKDHLAISLDGKVNSVQEDCFAVHLLKFEILQAT